MSEILKTFYPYAFLECLYEYSDCDWIEICISLPILSMMFCIAVVHLPTSRGRRSFSFTVRFHVLSGAWWHFLYTLDFTDLWNPKYLVVIRNFACSFFKFWSDHRMHGYSERRWQFYLLSIIIHSCQIATHTPPSSVFQWIIKIFGKSSLENQVENRTENRIINKIIEAVVVLLLYGSFKGLTNLIWSVDQFFMNMSKKNVHFCQKNFINTLLIIINLEHKKPL